MVSRLMIAPAEQAGTPMLIFCADFRWWEKVTACWGFSV